jgi:ubiquinol-cytochrome c reductase cytochrome c1 subunit
LIAILLLAPALAFAERRTLHLDQAPDKANDKAALQHGAKLFVNYCLNCHSASYMRYNRLQDIGLTEATDQGQSVVHCRESRRADEGSHAARGCHQVWFGAAPPDLTVIARARASEFGSGADWLYTYLRTFYRDESRPTGWNNVVFENVGMPHVLWELQGDQVMGS